MSLIYDFHIDTSTFVGMSLIEPKTEQGYAYLIEETEYPINAEGSSEISKQDVGDFISDATWAHLSCELVWNNSL